MYIYKTQHHKKIYELKKTTGEKGVFFVQIRPYNKPMGKENGEFCVGSVTRTAGMLT